MDPYVVLTLTPALTRSFKMLSERAAPPGWRTLRDMRGQKSLLEVEVMYSTIFSIKVGAQWMQSTGLPRLERVSQAAKIDDEDGGQARGGKERIDPFGRLERATEMPAI